MNKQCIFKHQPLNNAKYDDYIYRYNVKWNTPSECSRDSMPLGDGSTGLNIWADREALWILIGRTDIYEHNKLGRLKIAVEPNIFAGQFSLETDMYNGKAHIRADGVHIELFCDASVDDYSVLNVKLNSTSELKITASYELWREQSEASELTSLESDHGDCTFTFTDEPAWISYSNLAGNKMVVGGLMTGQGFTKTSASSIEAVSRDTAIRVYFDGEVCTNAGEWYNKVSACHTEYELRSADEIEKAHCNWWHDFWATSRIELSNTADAFSITQRYIMQRYIFACSSRGLLPPLYNGSIFRTEIEEGADMAFGWIVDKKSDADMRPWGSAYMGQNIRQLYWGLLTSGDYKLFDPLIRLIRGYLAYGRRETWETMGHDGFFIPERFEPQGFTYSDTDLAELPCETRLSRPDESWEKKVWHLQYHFIPTLEFTSMLVDLYLHCRDEKLKSEVVYPLVANTLKFYAEHYPERDNNGKMVIFPAGTAETYGAARSSYHNHKQQEDVRNSITEVALLRYLTAASLKAFEDDVELSKYLHEYRDMLPELPSKSFDGYELLAPGESYTPGLLCENAELYAIFPSRQITRTSDFASRAMAIRSYFLRRISLDGSSDCQYWETGGWHPAGLDAALLGLAEEASRILEINYSDSLPVISMINNKPYEHRPDKPRFPGFWNYAHMDGIPDQCHGGVSLNLLETMLLQWDLSGKIYLLPAWDSRRDVSFTLHAPDNTVVNCEYKDGRVLSLEVTPESRRADIINCQTADMQLWNIIEVKAADVNHRFGFDAAADGRLTDDSQIYRPLLKPLIRKFGEGLIGTNPWLIQTDTAHSFYKANRLYVFSYDKSSVSLPIHETPISVAGLGCDAAYEVTPEGIKVDFTTSASDDADSEIVCARLDFDRPIDFMRDNGIEYTVTASSELSESFAVDNICNRTESYWQCAKDDSAPCVTLSAKGREIGRIEIELCLPFNGYDNRHDLKLTLYSGGKTVDTIETQMYGRFFGTDIKAAKVDHIEVAITSGGEFGIHQIRLY